jgi:Xaa-Pro aminopeptidase
MSEPLFLVGESMSNQNLFYKTRFLAGDPFLYVESGESSTLLVPAMEVGRARKESSVEDVRAFNDLGYLELYREYGDSRRALTQVAVRLLQEYRVRRVRVEPTLPVQFADTLRAEGLEPEIDTRMIVDERRRKSSDEIAAIEAAQGSTERALARAIALIERSEEHAGTLHFNGIPLTSERIRAEIETALLRENLVSEVDPTVAGGESAADPHARGRGALRWGEAIVMDIFPRSRSSRYFADITRTVVKGSPSETIRAMHETVMQAHAKALSLVRSGANGADIHQAVLDVFGSAGYDGRPDRPSMPHGTGHGLGLDIHEAPRLGEIDVELLEDEVITIEPGLYHPDIGGVRVEDTIVVTRDGYRNLTTLSKRFELGL